MNIPIGKYIAAFIIAILISAILRISTNIDPNTANSPVEWVMIYTVIRTLGYIQELAIKQNNSAEK